MEFTQGGETRRGGEKGVEENELLRKQAGSGGREREEREEEEEEE